MLSLHYIFLPFFRSDETSNVYILDRVKTYTCIHWIASLANVLQRILNVTCDSVQNLQLRCLKGLENDKTLSCSDSTFEAKSGFQFPLVALLFF